MSRANVIELDEKEIIRLYIEELRPVLYIAKIFNVNFGTIRLRLKKNNIKFRSFSETQKISMNKESTKKLISIKSKEATEARHKTNIEKYGCKVASNNKEIKDNWKTKHLSEHGVIWPNQRKDVRDKFKNTCMESYGTDNVSKTDEVRDKISNNRWKNKTKEELLEIKGKTLKTNIERFGYENPLQNEEIKNKVKKSRWDDKSKEELDRIQKVSDDTRINNQTPIIIERLKQLNLELKHQFSNITSKIDFKCLKCNEEFTSVIDYIFNSYGLCPICFPRNSSIFFEREIIDFLRAVSNEKIITNDRSFLENKKELDIIIPSIKLAIECDGLFWHSDKIIPDKNYHLNKTNICKRKGYQLIHIFEDEWMFKKDIVKSRLKNMLGKYDIKIHGRKCKIREIDPKTKNEFLLENHIQGKDNSNIKLGAFHDDELVSVMTFSKGSISKGSKPIEGVWELNRFCSKLNYQVVGIASKLLSHFKNNYIWKEIFSYADIRWSDGNVYEKLGFKLSHSSKPNYWYVKGLQRIHRFNLRKRFDEPKEIPEWILRANEGFVKVWDCGNLKFSLTG